MYIYRLIKTEGEKKIQKERSTLRMSICASNKIHLLNFEFNLNTDRDREFKRFKQFL
jgi:hypothetical protein